MKHVLRIVGFLVSTAIFIYSAYTMLEAETWWRWANALAGALVFGCIAVMSWEEME